MRRLFLWILSLILLIEVTGQMFAAEDIDEIKITIYIFDFDALVSASAQEIDQILYPSGMKLPTKYMDFLDFIPYDHNIYRDDVARFLLQHYPQQDGIFTYPEYCAARRFIYFTSLQQEFGASNPIVSALVCVDQETECNFFDDITNVILLDADNFLLLIQQYREVLEEYAMGYFTDELESVRASFTHPDVSGERITAGLLYFTTELEKDMDPVSNTGENYSDYIRQLPVLWARLSATFEPTGLHGYLSDDSMVVLGLEKPSFENSSVSNNTPQSSISAAFSQPIEPEGSRVDEKAVKDLGEFSTRKEYNFKDVVSIIALVFSVATVTVLWVAHTIKRRRDPLRKWLS